MKRKGFTLVEVLVIIAIIILLVAVLAPSLLNARVYTRATICRNNLHQIGALLATAKRLSTPTLSSAVTIYRDWSPITIYPVWRAWPWTAWQYCGNDKIFRCPEDQDDPATQDVVDLNYVVNVLAARVEFRSTYQGGCAILLNGDPDGRYVLSRAGPDPNNPDYVEWVFEEARGVISQKYWNPPPQHNDGWVRIYNKTGILEVVSCTCGDLFESLWIDGKPAFGPDPANNQDTRMHLNVGVRIDLMKSTGGGISYAGGSASYGINKYANLYIYGDPTLVLLDYESLTANPDDVAAMRDLLSRSTRHFGQMNVLFADGSINTRSASELDPVLHPEVWNPRNRVNPD